MLNVAIERVCHLRSGMRLRLWLALTFTHPSLSGGSKAGCEHRY